jgi:hypothetical protein
MVENKNLAGIIELLSAAPGYEWSALGEKYKTIMNPSLVSVTNLKDLIEILKIAKDPVSKSDNSSNNKWKSLSHYIKAEIMKLVCGSEKSHIPSIIKSVQAIKKPLGHSKDESTTKVAIKINKQPITPKIIAHHVEDGLKLLFTPPMLAKKIFDKITVIYPKFKEYATKQDDSITILESKGRGSGGIYKARSTLKELAINFLDQETKAILYKLLDTEKVTDDDAPSALYFTNVEKTTTTLPYDDYMTKLDVTGNITFIKSFSEWEGFEA